MTTSLPPIRTARPSAEVLETNLSALARRNPRAADAVRAAQTQTNYEFMIAPDGGLTGRVGAGADARQIASLRAPREEGAKLAGTIDVTRSAAVVVRGFGAGHHVATLAQRMGFHGAIIVFEPDTGLLRGVLERADLSRVFRTTNLVLVTDENDTGALAQSLTGLEAVLASGTAILDHPPSRRRLGARADRFAEVFTTVMRAVRTQVVTTLVQVDVTVRNLLQNLRWYAQGPGISDLAGAARGHPALVVAAGPSLHRNIDLLTRPGVRDRFVIIAAQTVLRTLLEKGIRPHFVTALDYHEISRRFYEGLTASDVEGVTLVVEPKVNPAVCAAYPGVIRCVGDGVLDRVLGPALARPMGELPPGATVAHLSYYLARYLGCDPVILMGQDLGFTDGQYYSPGAAIHRVWGAELSEFNTLEMMEWQRIARMRPLLRRTTDTQGRPVYTDEQMSTYLVQFERDFMTDSSRGLVTVDATEGGVLKRHTAPMPLADALHRWGDGPVLPSFAPAQAARDRSGEVLDRLGELRRSCGRVGVHSRDAGELLDAMLRQHADQAAVNRLIERTHAIARDVASEPAYWLVQHVNQVGQLNRYKADRAKELDEHADALARQRLEIERDRQNVRWIGDVAAHAAELLDDAAATLRTGAVRTREVLSTPGRDAPTPRDVWAVMTLDPEAGGLGVPRPLDATIQSRRVIERTLARLARCDGIRSLLVLTPDPGAARVLLAGAPASLRIEVAPTEPARFRARATRVGAARLWSSWCWRSGIAGMTCYDEVFDAVALASHLRRLEIDSAMLLGADWAWLDPALADAVVARYRERPEQHAITFTQASPGLAPCVIATDLVEQLAVVPGPLATIGGLLGYSPIAPQHDPIARSVCVPVEPGVRDACARFIADSPEIVRALGELPEHAGAHEITPGVQGAAVHTLDLLVGVGTSAEHVAGEVRRACRPHTPCAVTLRGAPGFDVLGHAGWWELVRAARAAGCAGVHVRTTLACDPSEAERIWDSGVDVLSVDVFANSATTYRQITGEDAFDRVIANLGSLASRMPSSPGVLPGLWVVPRITRCDAVYEEIEDFYNRWVLTFGACVIDPLPAPIPGERIAPLPVPDFVARAAAARSHTTDLSAVLTP